MEELAEKLAESEHGLDNAEALVKRWTGHPERIAEDIFRVRNLDSGDIEDLSLFYPYQPKLMHAYFFGDGRIINVYKGRRIGVSFVFGVCMAIDGLASPGAFFPIVSRTKSQSESRIADIRDLIEHSKVIDIDDLVTDNKGEIELPNGAVFKAYTGDPEGARGDDSAKTVFVDEMAFLDDQEATMRAFMPFISLGDAKMLQVSTPRVSSDLFLRTHKRGSPTGNNGVISVKQPTFKNPDDIDVSVPLQDQNVHPVRPDLNIDTVEAERAQDPQGFAQEYLCKPVSDEYRFLSMDAIERAQKRGAAQPEKFEAGVGGGKAKASNAYWHPATHARSGGMMVMGVDIGIDRDDTAISVFEHVGDKRYLRFHTLVERNDLRQVGVYPEDPKNPDSIAQYLYRVSENMGVDKVFVDMTGPGRGFQQAIQHRLGKRAQGFNFSNKNELERMWGDLNYALHKNLITLVPDEDIHDQLGAIVKQQSYEDQTPRFSGKDQSEDGKDDLAMSIVLGAYPPNFKADRSTSPHTRKNVSGTEYSDADAGEDTQGDPVRAAKQREIKSRDQSGDAAEAFAAANSVRGVRANTKRSNNRHKLRHSRNRSSSNRRR